MSPEPATGLAAQRALSDYLRDPDHAPAPDGIEPRRLKIYRELFFGNLDNLLAGSFPVIRRVLDEVRWQALVRGFYRDHPARTPLFTELPREFLRYLQSRERAEAGADDPPWLPALAHYEWLELALQISELRTDAIACDPAGDLLTGRPLVDPLAWPQEYAWPVQRLGPDYLPTTPPASPTWLLLQRDAAGTVQFTELSALTFRLLQRLDQYPALTGRAQLHALATEAAAPSAAAFVAQGATMLQQLSRDGVLRGTRSD